MQENDFRKDRMFEVAECRYFDVLLISGFYVDTCMYYESIAKISELNAFILPDHGENIFDRSEDV
jgi:hypothetical protein